MNSDVGKDFPVLDKLVGLVTRLYYETNGFLDRQDDLQLWYNRGYANGMIQGINELGNGEVLQVFPALDGDDIIAGQEQLPWGKAYLHGFEVGINETYEVLEAR